MSDVPDLTIVDADLSNADHARTVVALVDAYARDPMGGGSPLPDDVREALAGALRDHPTTLVLLAYVGGEPAGVAVCFRGFSTFAARPIVNVHDLAVLPAHRGRGVGRRLLEAVVDRAEALGCAKVTLEVLRTNEPALGLYRDMGFGGFTGAETLFLQKPISPSSSPMS